MLNCNCWTSSILLLPRIQFICPLFSVVIIHGGEKKITKSANFKIYIANFASYSSLGVPGCHILANRLTLIQSGWTDYGYHITTHTACILFWIPKRQAISTDNDFIFKKINKHSIKEKKKKPTSTFRVTCELAMPIQPKRLVRPGQLAGNSERACGIFFSFLF